jgi:succinyl-CoA synthetase alpha subunit
LEEALSTKVIVKPREYYDSVRLMRVAGKLRQAPEVEECMLMMATESNRRLLDIAGLMTGAVREAGPNDLVIAIVAADEAAAEETLEQAERMLRQRAGGTDRTAYRTLASAQRAISGANLALISVPGEYAAAEARRALERGLHVMVFSDNVALEDEVDLKQVARRKGLLMMGPDCGTAILNGVALGFANVVKRGPVGIVGASGTGIQEISVFLHRHGPGLSHAIGTGGRDLSAPVGGMTMRHGIDLLAADDATRVIVLCSKPPDPAVARSVLERAGRCDKPVVVNFLGGDPQAVSEAGLTPAQTLEAAARRAIALVEGEEPSWDEDRTDELVASEAARLGQGQRFIRGLYSGGTLCTEAMLVLGDGVGEIYSNIPLRPEFELADPWQSQGHTLVDLGADEFTQGRAHPMIDPTLRVRRIEREARDPEVAVVLLDVVLGYGSHDDPAGSLAPAIAQAKAQAEAAGRYLSVVASVCGTELDPQDLQQQEEVLREVGVVVASSNAQAARIASRIVAS